MNTDVCLELSEISTDSLTLLVAENTRFPSLSSGMNFCSKAFCTFQMAGGSTPAFRVTYIQ